MLNSLKRYFLSKKDTMKSLKEKLMIACLELARYTNNPAKEHWFALVRVLRYLKHTIEYGLHYIRYPFVIEGFSDVNWIYDSLESKSTSGYIFTLGGTTISWKSFKQTCIA